jgi:hypothetical protein
MAEITLYDNHLPSLRAGTYKIEVQQTLTVGSNDSLILDLPERKSSSGNNSIEKNLEFTVAGEHYAINPLQIDSAFPPAGSMGDFSLVLPHIILNRSTLPWENKAGDGVDTTPWLALLLFHEEELADSEGDASAKDFFVKHVPLSEWDTKQSSSEKEEQVSLLVCNKATGWDSHILPSYNELPLFTHVRLTDGVVKAVVVCKRLPQKDKKNIVHLVSLEGCFNESGEFVGKSLESELALVSLKSWEFFCNDHFIISEELIESSTLPDDLQKEALRKMKGREYFKDDDIMADYKKEADVNSIPESLLSTFRIGQLPQILKHLNRTPSSLRLPDPDTDIQNEGLNGIRAGYVDLPYQLKTGKTISAYYRGSIVPKAESPSDDWVGIFHADKALRYIKDVNKLDVSYAAAWELGKLLAIQNKNFSVALYKWKRACYQAIKLSKKKSPEQSPEFPEAPKFVEKWFKQLKSLEGIPFNYLVPDPAMIPFESIRFFEIDETWLAYLIDGAFSIGRISNADKSNDQLLYYYPGFKFLQTLNSTRSGFLLHSVAVAGWPDLVIYNNTEGNAPCRKEKLSPNLLICLFDEQIGNIGIHQKPETIHFGIKEEEVEDYKTQGIIGIPGITSTSLPSKIAEVLMGNAEVEVVQFNLVPGE